MKNPKIVVVGSANTDMIVRVSEIPKPGETVLGGKFDTALGGKGANQAVAAARLGADVTFVARLGKDDFGRKAFSAYQDESIRTEFIVWDANTPSGVALILVNQEGENIIAVAPGANSKLCPADVNSAEEAFKTADTLLVQLEVPLDAIQAAINLAQKHHMKVVLNPAPAMDLSDEILTKIDYLTPNESEFSLLTGIPVKTALAGAGDYKRRKRLKTLVITLGAQGARIVTDDVDTIVPGFPVEVVDTVAAGDAFNGALAVSLSSGMDLRQAVRFANAVGALAVTQYGAQPSLPHLDQVLKFVGGDLENL